MTEKWESPGVILQNFKFYNVGQAYAYFGRLWRADQNTVLFFNLTNFLTSKSIFDFQKSM